MHVRSFRVFIAATAVFLFLEALIFRTGFYARVIEPSSSTGSLELTLNQESARRPFGRDEVLVCGDSRIGEGFHPKLVNDACAKGDYYFASAGIAGATTRYQYYFLRDVDPTRKRYRAIVLAVDAYDDIDYTEDLSDRMLDLHYCILRLRYRDAFEFASSFATGRSRFEAFRGSILKGLTLQEDLLALFEHRRKRLSEVATWRAHGSEWVYNYQGHESDLDGITVDWKEKTIHFPDKIPMAVRTAISDDLFGPIPPQDGRMERYRRLWYGRILDLYRDSDTKLIFLALPRGPVVPPIPRFQPPSHSIRDLARIRSAILLPDNLFEPLERGRFFFDSLHLNAQGRAQFSRMLASVIHSTLGPSRN
jgi:hypothetical protein